MECYDWALASFTALRTKSESRGSSPGQPSGWRSDAARMIVAAAVAWRLSGNALHADDDAQQPVQAAGAARRR
jgi:hypothetical protein